MTEIAPLRADERAKWEALWGAYQRFYEVELPTAVTDATWERLFSGRIHGLGARDATGRLVGFTHFLYHEDTWSMARACYLQDLYVDETVRGSGCGPAIYRICTWFPRRAPAAAGGNSSRRLPRPRARRVRTRPTGSRTRAIRSRAVSTTVLPRTTASFSTATWAEPDQAGCKTHCAARVNTGCGLYRSGNTRLKLSTLGKSNIAM